MSYAIFFLDFGHTENQTRPTSLPACSSPGQQICRLTQDKLGLKNSAIDEITKHRMNTSSINDILLGSET
jgi:hypothetical protein